MISDVALTIPGVQALADGELQPLWRYLHLLMFGPLQDLMKCRYLTDEISFNSGLPSVALLVTVEMKCFLSGQFSVKYSAEHQRLPDRAQRQWQAPCRGLASRGEALGSEMGAVSAVSASGISAASTMSTVRTSLQQRFSSVGRPWAVRMRAVCGRVMSACATFIS